MDDSPEEIIERERWANEQLLWVGRPPRGLILQATDVFLIPFSLLWGGFAIVWETMALADGPWYFGLFGVPFVLVGLYMIVGRFWIDSWQRAGTYYGVTSERVLIVSMWLGRRIKSLAIDSLTDVSFSERSNGRGTITFGSIPPMLSWHYWGTVGSYGRGVLPSLVLSENAREVYRIILDAQRAAKLRG
jgi:hypothetical protein